MKRLLEEMPDPLLRDAVVAIIELEHKPDGTISPSADWYHHMLRATGECHTQSECRMKTSASNVRDLIREEASYRWLGQVSPQDCRKIDDLKKLWQGE